MIQDHGESSFAIWAVRMGSGSTATVEFGRLRSGDSFRSHTSGTASITGSGMRRHWPTTAPRAGANDNAASLVGAPPPPASPLNSGPFMLACAGDNALAAAVRGCCPRLADRCQIQVIVKMHDEDGAEDGAAEYVDVSTRLVPLKPGTSAAIALHGRSC